MTDTRSTCPYCGVGCGVIIESEGTQITGVRGDPDHPANFGRLCTKGSTLHLTASAPITRQTRLLRPMQRARRGEAPQPLDWDAALDQAAGRFAGIVQTHGPDAVGFYVSGQLLTEDYYVFNKLAKGLVGTNNIDTNSRLCMSSAVAGYKQTLGADAPPACYDDLRHAQCLFIVGSNTAWAHPILFRRIEDAKAANPALKIVVADPRRTDTVEIADLFLPLQPGTDVMLFNGMLHLMLREGWIDVDYIAAHTSGFEALKATVGDCTPETVARVCGLSTEQLFEAARLFATSPATLSLYCQGLNQSSSGTAKNAALINLHLATGQIGRAGAGPFSLTGQPNAMGGREVGGLANLLSAHRDLANPAHRAEVAALWGVPSVPAQPGKTAVEMFQAAADGEIRALWIACTNPAQSMPDQATVRRALERAEFVVVQEAFATTATCAYADLLLPATTWGEKEGTVTNSERRISRVRPAVPPAGEARHDWSIAAEFARRLEARLGRAATLFPYENAESVWNEHRESTRGRDLDITGLSWALLEHAGPQQWPLREGETAGRARLYEDGVFPTPDGRARFVDTVYRPLAEPREPRWPFSLNTGRLRDQWHGMSRTGNVGRLFGHVAEPAVQMNPQDMARRALREGDLVHLSSRRGSILLPARASEEIAPDQAFVAMHWGGEYLGGSSSTGTPLAGINTVTTPAYCPISKQPELKHVPVKILKAELPWSLLAMAWLPDDDALAARRALQALMAAFPFAACVPFSGADGSRGGLLFRAAAHEAPDDALLSRIEGLLGLQAPDTLRYADRRRGQRRAARLARRSDGARLEAFLLGGDTSAEAWIATVLREELPAQDYGRLLLSPGARAPVAVQSRGKPVCTCFNVTDLAIERQLRRCDGSPAERLAALQGALKCGTNCGSCIPELKRRVRSTPVEALA
ncbi:nitrate reductase [Variovorax paradoxus]|jgi:assimilatory nitrate reductase catalytic subunit|nr:nitrate reductase [Variovorax paradoxus]KPV06665.1 nitrate reductase [Variovorax paradoxus]KPV08610.1 nitrate reductase [Variovorax paradoxus]KPV22057.1 nitrate reductase [Variovorax paradoxus]KPV32372.1 nitrate reductase [Variovorax paradoxus]